MKLKFAAICSVTLLACAAASAPAFAGQLNWDFFTLTGSPTAPGTPLGTTDSFTQGSQTLGVASYTAGQAGCTVAMGSSCTWSPGQEDLYAKNGGQSYEQGLGLYNSSQDYEIYSPNGIMVTLPTGTYATSVMIGSLQGQLGSGEAWAVYGNDNGTWNLLGNGSGGLTENFNSSSLMGYSQLIISDPVWSPYTSNNNVLMSVTTNTMSVPEPGTLALFGVGLLGCALMISRRRRARQS